MASNDEKPIPVLAWIGGDTVPPGRPTMTSMVLLEKGATALQSLCPLKQVKQHVCMFTLYAHDPRWQVETHHFVSRLNQDFLQCAIYDSNNKKACLIGVEYIVSRKIFETLPAKEQRLWHTHTHEIKEALWVNLALPCLGRLALDFFHQENNVGTSAHSSTAARGPCFILIPMASASRLFQAGDHDILGCSRLVACCNDRLVHPSI